MASSDDGSYILTKDVQGEKPRPKVLSLFTKKPKRFQVPRGELISPRDMRLALSGGNPAGEFSLKRDPRVTLQGDADGTAVSPLDKLHSELLEAIRHPSDRFAIFSDDNKLDWGSKLKRGDKVYVKLPGSKSSVHTCSLAVVRSVGEVDKQQGRTFGVEIIDPQYYGRGSTDGIFGAFKYFNCEKDRGLFVSLDKLSLQPNPPTLQTTKQHLRQLTNSPLLLKRSSCPSECDSYKLSILPQTGSHRDLCQIQHNTNNCEAAHGNWTAVNLVCTCTPQEDQSPGPNTHGITQVPSLLLNSNTLLPMESSLPPERNYSQDSIPPRMDSSPAHLDFSLEVGTLVQLPTTDPNNPFHYGTIRWISNAGQYYYEQVAGIELEEYNVMDGCNDGTFPVTGIKYFDCPSGHGLYFPLASLRPDERFASGADTSTGGASNDNPQPPNSPNYKATSTACNSQFALCKDDPDSCMKELITLRDDILKFEKIKKDNVHHLAENINLQDQLHSAKAEAEAAKQEKQLVDEKLLGCKSEILSLRNELETRSSGVWKVSADKVEIGTEIGVGGWGTVLNGTIKVAIKRLHPAILNPRNISRIKREMKLLAEVQHPNLVQFIGTVYDEEVERDQKPPLIVIELLDMNLRQAYEQNNLQPNNHLSIFTDVALALNYLHQRYEPIIHRDVSAPNVLLQRLPGNMWRGKVSDLGSANFLKQASTMGDGAILYSPPEVIPRAFDHSQKHMQQTVKIDVYSYGVLLCEVNTSRLPDAGNYREMIEQVQREQPQMHALIVHCTQEDPKDRPTMADILVALHDIPQV